MTYDSNESSPQEKQRIHASHQRASQAMLNLIVLRDIDGVEPPNLDSDSHEGWLRLQVFHLQSEAFRLDPAGEFDAPTEISLAETMMNPYLAHLAEPGRPITPERLTQIEPALLGVAASMDDEGIGWPTADQAFHYVLPENFSDTNFGEKLVKRGEAYNNFPAMLAAAPNWPTQGENYVEFMHRVPRYQYATKPYLTRAHALQPEFMGALQQRMADINSLNDWQDSLLRAVFEDHPDPEDQILLRASRLAYQLLINLMRKDDLQIQYRRLSMSTQIDITDPREELWT